MKRPIAKKMNYLDHNATSPLRPEAQAAVLEGLAVGGNPSSVHARGRKARAIVEAARADIAALLHARPEDTYFTSGGTEANALALAGAVQGAAETDARITRLFVSAIEHPSVLENAVALGERIAGLRVELLAVTADGLLDVNLAGRKLREGKGRALLAVMAANNETGVIQPLDQVQRLAKETHALLLVDAVQAAGRLDLNFETSGADYFSVSSHKLGGPQGVGALVVRDGAPFSPTLRGGGQERGHRAGTENVSGIAGFRAAAVASGMEVAGTNRMATLRDRFEARLGEAVPDAVIFGSKAHRLVNTSNFAVPGISAETALIALDLDGVMLSSGAACSSGKVRPSHVLSAMGVSAELARSALRVSFGWNSTDDDVDAAIAALTRLSARLSKRQAA